MVKELEDDEDQEHEYYTDFFGMRRAAGLDAYVLRLFPLCALVPRVQGSSGAVASVRFVWRGHAKTPTTRAGPWPDFALRLE